jgi:DNA repair exonuclease SbcCD ATPase subunit
MDNDTYDDRHSRQNTFNKNIVKRIQELEDKKPSKLDDQVDIKLMKQEEWNEKVIERLDQGIENRTKAFERIEELEEQLKLFEQYTIKGLADSLRDLQYNTDVKLERNDEIRAVHRNEIDNLKKNLHELKKVWDNKIMDLLEKDMPRVTDKEQAIIDLNKKLFGNKKGEHGKE